MRAPSGVFLVSPPNARKQGHANPPSLSRKRKTHAHSCTVRYAAGVSISVDGFGRLGPGVPYRTLYSYGPHDQKLERMHRLRLPALPAVAKQEGETRACVIATGLWVPPRFHSVAPKVSFLCRRSVIVYSDRLCSRARTQTAGKVGFTQGLRKLQLSGMPKLIGHRAECAGRLT